MYERSCRQGGVEGSNIGQHRHMLAGSMRGEYCDGVVITYRNDCRNMCGNSKRGYLLVFSRRDCIDTRNIYVQPGSAAYRCNMHIQRVWARL